MLNKLGIIINHMADIKLELSVLKQRVDATYYLLTESKVGIYENDDTASPAPIILPLNNLNDLENLEDFLKEEGNMTGVICSKCKAEKAVQAVKISYFLDSLQWWF